MIRVSCPKCKAILQVEDKHAGQVIACSSCKASLRLPKAPSAPPPPSPPVSKASKPTPTATTAQVADKGASQKTPGTAAASFFKGQAKTLNGRLKTLWQQGRTPIKAAVIGGTSVMFLSFFLCCGFLGYKILPRSPDRVPDGKAQDGGNKEGDIGVNVRKKTPALISVKDNVIPGSWDEVSSFPFDAVTTEGSTNSLELAFFPTAASLFFSGPVSPSTIYPLSRQGQPTVINAEKDDMPDKFFGWGRSWSSPQISPDGKTIIGVQSGKLTTYSIETRTKTALDIKTDYVRLSSQGNTLLVRTKDSKFAEDGKVTAMHFPSRQHLHTFEQTEYASRSPFSFSHDGKSFALIKKGSGKQQSPIAIYSLAEKSAKVFLARRPGLKEGAQPSFPLFSFDDRFVIVRWGNEICVYTASDGSLYKSFLQSASFVAGDHLPSIRSIAVSPTQHTIAMTGGVSQFLGIWDYKHDTMVFVPGPKARSDVCCFSPNGGVIATAGEDGQIRVVQGISGEGGKYKPSPWTKNLYLGQQWLTKFHVGKNATLTEDATALWGAGTCVPGLSKQCGKGIVYFNNTQQEAILRKYIDSLGDTVLLQGQKLKWQMSDTVGCKLFVGFDETVLSNPNQLRQKMDDLLQPFARGIARNEKIPISNRKDDYLGLSAVPNSTVNLFVCSSDLKETYARGKFGNGLVTAYRLSEKYRMSDEIWQQINGSMSENWPVYGVK